MIDKTRLIKCAFIAHYIVSVWNYYSLGYDTISPILNMCNNNLLIFTLIHFIVFFSIKIILYFKPAYKK